MVLSPASTSAKFLLPAPEYEQQLRTTYENGGDRVLAGSRELPDSQTRVVLADGGYDSNATVDLSQNDLTGALRPFGDVNVQLTSYEEFCY